MAHLNRSGGADDGVPPTEQDTARGRRRSAGDPHRRPPLGDQLRPGDPAAVAASRSSSGTSSSGCSSAPRCTYAAHRLVLARQALAQPAIARDQRRSPTRMTPLTPLRGTGIDWVALTVLIVLFAVVTVLGFMATRFRRGDTLDSLDEWGLGGRKFGTWVTWFLLGGDLYTAYTFIAVPAAMFATGAVAGFFAVPYTIILYPIIFIFMARLWSVSHRHGYVTTADFVRGRYDSRVLSLAVAVTGFVATMPYIALQLVGIQAVLEVVGLGGSGNWLAKDLPLLIAFVLLAAYTYTSGLRAPGGDRVRQGRADLPGHHRRGRSTCPPRSTAAGPASSAPPRRRWRPPTRRPASRPASFIPGTGQMWAYATLALGSAMALFMYPALGHRDALLRQSYDDPPQRLDPAGVLLRAGPAGPARLGGDRRGHEAGRRRRQAQPAAGDPAAVRGLLLELVRRGRLRRGGDRRARAGGDHVDRGRRTRSPATSTRSGSTPTRPTPQEAKVSKLMSLVVKALRAGLRAHAGQAERHQLPAARRHLDPADVPRRRVQPLHAVVPP